MAEACLLFVAAIPISILCYREFYRLQNERELFANLSENIQELQAKVKRLEESQLTVKKDSRSQHVVAFVSRRNGEVSLTGDQTLIFNQVLRNTNRAYNPGTGVFVAPFNGNYLFSATVLSVPGEYASLKIVKNHSIPVGFLHTGPGSAGHHGSGSETVVVDLQKGDEVCVKVNTRDVAKVHGEGWGTFMGVLLTEY